jgi:sugar diacid utilization regulator
MSKPPVAEAPADRALREQLSSLQGLLALSMVMTESGDERHILHLAATSVPALGRSRTGGVYLVGEGWRNTQGACVRADVQADIEAQLTVLTTAGGAVAIMGEPWAWAYPLRSFAGHFGFLIVSADGPPPAAEQFLLRILAQQTGIALANARLHARERATAAALRSTNAALAATVADFERTTHIHDRLTRVAVAGEGEEGIAQAIHELTRLPVAVEDRHGNLRAWAGPGRPDPYPKDPPGVREEVLRRARRQGKPIEDRGRLLAIANPRHDLLGVLVLVDPDRGAGEQELVALEHGATVLAMELARLQSMAETELRLGRDILDELLAGNAAEHVLARAQALGYDLERPHRVAIVEAPYLVADDDALLHAVRRAARDTGLGSLLVPRRFSVVVLAEDDSPWDQFRTAVRHQLDNARCRIGVGGTCMRPADFPRSYREAGLALKVQDAADGVDRITVFDQLGVYQLLADVQETSSVERFVQEWLGSLLSYDHQRHTELVVTLRRYLEHGGSYDASAKALAVHRSTLKYRLQRIRAISGHDLADPETQFNLQLAMRAQQTLLALRGAEA